MNERPAYYAFYVYGSKMPAPTSEDKKSGVYLIGRGDARYVSQLLNYGEESSAFPSIITSDDSVFCGASALEYLKEAVLRVRKDLAQRPLEWQVMMGHRLDPDTGQIGAPVLETASKDNPGNGTFIQRIYDFQGRLSSVYQHYVDPTRSVDGEPFADAATTSFYNGLYLSMGSNLSAGQMYGYVYDHKGQLENDWGRELYFGATSFLTDRLRGYSKVGQLVGETMTYEQKLVVTRSYQYNRRGQRTVATDAVTLLGTGSLTGERNGRIDYTYDATTARLTSVQATVDSGGTLTYARIKWFYDRGGRDTLHIIRMNPNAGTGAGDSK